MSYSKLLILALGGVHLLGCAGPEKRKSSITEGPTVVRLITVEVPDGSGDAWLAACRRLAHSAKASQVDANWLIHRFENRSYYLLTFGSLADFREASSIVNGFVRHDVAALVDEFNQLHSVPYEIRSDEIWEQIPAWSTTSEMNSRTHPGVDQRTFRVAPDLLPTVDDLLSDMANLLKNQEYPYPTEGFRVLSGPAGVVHVVTFFDNREEYYFHGQPREYLAARGLKQVWLNLEERLAEITSDAVRTESWYIDEASFDPWLDEETKNQEGG